MMDAKGQEDKIIQELIIHINRLESKISAIEEKSSDAADVPVVNKLDIINLKNEIEKIKMVFPSISKEQIKKFQSVAKILESDKLGQLGESNSRLESAEKNLDILNERINSLETATIPEDLAEDIRKLKTLSEKKQPNDLEQAISDLSLEFKKIKERIAGLKPVKIPEGIENLADLKEEINKLSYLPKNIRKLEKQVESSTLRFLESRKDIEKTVKRMVQEQLKKVSSDVSTLKKSPNEKEKTIDIGRLKKEITRDLLREFKKMVS